jgi:hypothetical protein
MKILGFLLVVLFACMVTAPAGADICVKQKSHMDEYYYGGTVTPEDNSESEIWLGDRKMAVYSPNSIVIVDVGKGILVYANTRDSSYVETTLPFDWTNVVDEETAGRLARYQTEGTVKSTGETKKIQGRKCELYEVNTWIEDGGTQFNHRDQRVWMTTDLPIDWDVYDKINTIGLVLQNYDDGLIEAMSAVRGVRFETDADVYQQGFSVKSVETAVEIIEKTPDKDVYSLPAWFTKKDQLTMADLRG